jgi:hypothetical protein
MKTIKILFFASIIIFGMTAIAAEGEGGGDKGDAAKDHDTVEHNPVEKAAEKAVPNLEKIHEQEIQKQKELDELEKRTRH